MKITLRSNPQLTDVEAQYMIDALIALSSYQPDMASGHEQETVEAQAITKRTIKNSLNTKRNERERKLCLPTRFGNR